MPWSAQAAEASGLCVASATAMLFRCHTFDIVGPGTTTRPNMVLPCRLPIIKSDYAEVPLTDGPVAIVDLQDLHLVCEHLWCTGRGGRNRYARRRDGKKFISMHRVIMGDPPGLHVDHIDGNGLNNRRANLRLCAHLQNLRNRRLNANNSSGFKGVYWDRRIQRWRASIKSGGKVRHIGCFKAAEEAARAYDQTATEAFGPFAKTNAMLGLLPAY